MTFEDEPLSPELQALLDAEKARPAVPSEVSARLADKLASSLSLAPEALSPEAHTPVETSASASYGAASASSVPSTLLTLGVSSSRLWPLVLTFALGSATGATMTAAWMKRERAVERAASTAASTKTEEAAHDVAPQAPAKPPAPTQAATPAEAQTDAPQQKASAEDAREASPRSLDSHDPSAQTQSLGAEQRLLEQARAALARGLARDALTALDRHKARFPRGLLREEREGLRVPVLVALGQDDEARKAAARFLARYPSSLFAPAVERALASIP